MRDAKYEEHKYLWKNYKVEREREEKCDEVKYFWCVSSVILE